MKLSLLQENFKRGLAIVSHAVAPKSSLPVLGNILLATDEGRLKLSATNLEIGITCWIGAKVEDEGATTIPAKLLSDFVGDLPNDLIKLWLDERTQTTNFMCANVDGSIKGIEADEFPVITTIADRTPNASFPAALLRETIDLVAFAALTDQTHPMLRGVLLRLRGNTATFAAADGYRLARRVAELPEAVTEPIDVIIPATSIMELARILTDEDTVDVTVTPTGGQVLFHTESIDFVSRVIEGNYPDIERIIPTNYATRTVLETADFAKAVKIASHFAVKSSDIVRLLIESGGDLAPGKVTISANAAEVGDNKSVIDGLVHGDGGQIALNVKLLQAAIGAIGTKQIVLETKSSQYAAVLKPVGDDTLLQMVMPMNIR
jgi:DNA polymerase-3 subunit beta